MADGLLGTDFGLVELPVVEARPGCQISKDPQDTAVTLLVTAAGIFDTACDIVAAFQAAV